MPLQPLDEAHALQIQAGTLGRKAGHDFEDRITAEINAIQYPLAIQPLPGGHVKTGDPALHLLRYVACHIGQNLIHKAVAISTGALATSEEGRHWLNINGADVRRCKSDLVLTLTLDGQQTQTFGISTKQCNNRTPTNAQLYFTTARGFANLLRNNGIPVSDTAVSALRQFCGDVGFRPLDDAQMLNGRLSDPRRYFWEEINAVGREEWESLFNVRQNEITRLMLQKAYIDDPFIPDFLLHKTKLAQSWDTIETAIYSIDEIIALSQNYGSFNTREYAVRKGSYRDPPGTLHKAPRFGIVQMQRGGQTQHPDQLQFNLEAGYFYKIENGAPQVLC